MLKDSFKYALTSMRQRKLRSWLTIIGIVIGVASIIALVAISQGMQNYIEEEFESFGTNIIMVQAGASFGMPSPGEIGLTDRDVRVIERVSGVDYVVAMIYETANVEFHREELQLPVFGYPADRYGEILGDTDYGFVTGGMYSKDSTDAVLGYLAATDLFEDELHLRNRITIDGQTFKVVGILEKIGNHQDDTSIAIPFDTARDLFNKTNEVSMMMVIVDVGVDVEKVADKIRDKLEDERGEEDFLVISATQLIAQISGILGAIGLIVGAIASISLLVGAVGIMNTMYTSVLERTREIGVMKAIGATNANIMSIFLMESGFLGLVGGTIGVGIGSAIALGVGYIAPSLDLPLTLLIRIDPELALFGIGFAVFLGALAGFFPARSASKLKPADALRYE